MHLKEWERRAKDKKAKKAAAAAKNAAGSPEVLDISAETDSLRQGEEDRMKNLLAAAGSTPMQDHVASPTGTTVGDTVDDEGDLSCGQKFEKRHCMACMRLLTKLDQFMRLVYPLSVGLFYIVHFADAE
jgi:hypothetical protein